MPDDADHDQPTTHGDPMPDDDTHADQTTGEPMTEHPTPQLVFHTDGEPMTDDEANADTQRTIPPEDAARAVLHGLACELGTDELRVLARIAERLKGGQASYSQLCLETDPRSFRTKEAREEVEDALVYLACAWLKTEAQEVT